MAPGISTLTYLLTYLLFKKAQGCAISKWIGMSVLHVNTRRLRESYFSFVVTLQDGVPHKCYHLVSESTVSAGTSQFLIYNTFLLFWSQIHRSAESKCWCWLLVIFDCSYTYTSILCCTSCVKKIRPQSVCDNAYKRLLRNGVVTSNQTGLLLVLESPWICFVDFQGLESPWKQTWSLKVWRSPRPSSRLGRETAPALEPQLLGAFGAPRRLISFAFAYISSIWSLKILEKSLNLILTNGQEPCKQSVVVVAVVYLSMLLSWQCTYVRRSVGQ